jgi:hypothetical protein
MMARHPRCEIGGARSCVEKVARTIIQIMAELLGGSFAL